MYCMCFACGSRSCFCLFTLFCRLQVNCCCTTVLQRMCCNPINTQDSVVCVFSSHSFWTSSSLDIPAGVTHRISHPPSFCGACHIFFSQEGFSHSFPSSTVESNFVYYGTEIQDSWNLKSVHFRISRKNPILWAWNRSILKNAIFKNRARSKDSWKWAPIFKSGSLENGLCVTWSGFWLCPAYLWLLRLD